MTVPDRGSVDEAVRVVLDEIATAMASGWDLDTVPSLWRGCRTA